ncbi:hypothetical protein Vadar_028265 [Vaccinium darrowii]|uniref:Uncharacterized protein n=1 Tax=Vaccinium darrowii TaxID=229202 RepID=A0ACB7Z0Q3_9ERIC|nr:hypothetical protein Vadar_028265 [Vaccinium darrowii]
MDEILCDELLQEVFHCLPPPSSSSTATTANIFLSQFPYLSSLSLSTPAPSDAVSTFSDNLLLSAASSCPKLRILHLHSSPVSFFPLLFLSSSCPHRTSLCYSLDLPNFFDQCSSDIEIEIGWVL